MQNWFLLIDEEGTVKPRYERRGKETSSEGPLNLFQSSALCLGDPNGNKYNSKSTHNHINGEGSYSKWKTKPISLNL